MTRAAEFTFGPPGAEADATFGIPVWQSDSGPVSLEINDVKAFFILLGCMAMFAQGVNGIKNPASLEVFQTWRLSAERLEFLRVISFMAVFASPIGIIGALVYLLGHALRAR